MSKQTSTARSINDLFNDDNANPRSGDTASQGQVTMKPDSASASAARLSRAAAQNAADITMSFHTNGDCYTTPESVDNDGTVTVKLKYDGNKNKTPLKVSTKLDNTPMDVFAGTSPYDATTAGNTYTLNSGIVGTITLDAGGTTGTINVGGGPICPPEDGDGDHHHRDR